MDILSNLFLSMLNGVLYLFLPFLLAAILFGMAGGSPARLLGGAFLLLEVFVKGIVGLAATLVKAVYAANKPKSRTRGTYRQKGDL